MEKQQQTENLLMNLALPLPGGETALSKNEFCPGIYLSEILKTLTEDGAKRQMNGAREILKETVRRRTLAGDSLIHAYERYEDLGTTELGRVREGLNKLDEINSPITRVRSTMKIINTLMELRKTILIKHAEENRNQIEADLLKKLQESKISNTTLRRSDRPYIGSSILKALEDIVDRWYNISGEIKNNELIKALQEVQEEVAHEIGILINFHFENNDGINKKMSILTLKALINLYYVMRDRGQNDFFTKNDTVIVATATKYNRYKTNILEDTAVNLSNNRAKNDFTLSIQFASILGVLNESLDVFLERSHILIDKKILTIEKLSQWLKQFLLNTFNELIFAKDAPMRNLGSSTQAGPHYHSHFQWIVFIERLQVSWLKHQIAPLELKHLYTKLESAWHNTFHNTFMNRELKKCLTISCLETMESIKESELQKPLFFSCSDNFQHSFVSPDENIKDEWLQMMLSSEAIITNLLLNWSCSANIFKPTGAIPIECQNMSYFSNDYYQTKGSQKSHWLAQSKNLSFYLKASYILWNCLTHSLGPIHYNGNKIWVLATDIQYMLRQISLFLTQYITFISTDLVKRVKTIAEDTKKDNLSGSKRIISLIILIDYDLKMIKENLFDFETGIFWESFRTKDFSVLYEDQPRTLIQYIAPYWTQLISFFEGIWERCGDKLLNIIINIEEASVKSPVLAAVKTFSTILLFNEQTSEMRPSRYITLIVRHLSDIRDCINRSGADVPSQLVRVLRYHIGRSLHDLFSSIVPQLDQSGVSNISQSRLIKEQVILDLKELRDFATKCDEKLRINNADGSDYTNHWIDLQQSLSREIKKREE